MMGKAKSHLDKGLSTRSKDNEAGEATELELLKSWPSPWLKERSARTHSKGAAGGISNGGMVGVNPHRAWNAAGRIFGA